jgi:DnaD/phage-associated family protein
MKKFSGFPARMEFTSIPNVFFSSLLPQITDIAELKTTLHVLAALYRKRGYPRFVTYSELLGNAGLMSSLKGAGEPPDEVLRGALKVAAERGTIIQVVLDRNGVSEDAYFLNTESDRQAVDKVRNGEIKLSGLGVKKAYVEVEELPDIFTLYENNIGILTPMMSEELKDIEQNYPEEWIKEAIGIAVKSEKRSLRYIEGILKSWKQEGKTDGTYQRHLKKTDPDRFIKGKYGHMVWR